jgi:hypothetical protein
MSATGTPGSPFSPSVTRPATLAGAPFGAAVCAAAGRAPQKAGQASAASRTKAARAGASGMFVSSGIAEAGCGAGWQP